MPWVDSCLILFYSYLRFALNLEFICNCDTRSLPLIPIVEMDSKTSMQHFLSLIQFCVSAFSQNFSTVPSNTLIPVQIPFTYVSFSKCILCNTWHSNKTKQKVSSSCDYNTLLFSPSFSHFSCFPLLC